MGSLFIIITSSRTKTSLLEYNELMMISITLDTFDSNLKFSGSTSAVTSLATLRAELRNVLIPVAVGKATRVVTYPRGKNACVFATRASNVKLHRKFMIANAPTAFTIDSLPIANATQPSFMFCLLCFGMCYMKAVNHTCVIYQTNQPTTVACRLNHHISDSTNRQNRL